MIHPINSIAVFFVDQTQQAQCVVQCIQAAPPPEWKWWMGALAPWVGPLLSGVVSIYVAWRVFRWQGEKDQHRWTLDQKKADWRDILTVCNEVDEQYLPTYREDETLDALIERVRGLHSLVRSLSGKYVFISDTLNSEPLRFNDYTQVIEQTVERLEALRFTKHANIRIPEEYNNLRSGFKGFMSRLGTSAQVDLGIWVEDDHGLLIPSAWKKTKK
jgi:hypothetical protein